MLHGFWGALVIIQKKNVTALESRIGAENAFVLMEIVGRSQADMLVLFKTAIF